MGEHFFCRINHVLQPAKPFLAQDDPSRLGTT